MSRNYKNIIKNNKYSFGKERRKNLEKEVLENSTPIPSPVEYKDIDEEFLRWTKEDLDISFNDEKVPTIALFSNQRFSEYMQSWQNSDDQKNIILNFKAVSRENNPKTGTLFGNTKNIPGDRYYLLKRVKKYDKNDRVYYIDYRMKQPFTIDLIYTLSIVTDKLELLNKFNILINDKFKSINCYIRPKGHFMGMILNDISDESEYSINNRRYYSQSYNITVKAYIITEDSYKVEERPELQFLGFEGDMDRAYADIEELEGDYDNVPIVLNVYFKPCTTSYIFKIDCAFKAEEIILENVRGFKFYVNDKESVLDKNLVLKTNDEIKIKGLTRYKTFEESIIKINGYDPFSSYKKEKCDNDIEITK